ncbi:haloalkane dehalogenase [Aureibacter tunicatorum]|uniref:Haloalkane dehalogenase n=1 Tax=Aureibacter tunicatorum TaxID=866807 RepID=A0AAE3XN55_9BACT|nr:haloalkane dehalogenase [Aureibacter tunicatorum]MDR6238114.1 haloalkane dehalogenase [Aureibacter tunicatorum]BDD03147.1 haloalkane dehalogenase [Aureibacter tunicatorum]
MEVLKPDLNTFKFIRDFSYQENYIAYENMHMHYIDEGNGEVILALHGEPSWSYLYRKFIPKLENYRFIAPDLIGFGKSDKIVGAKNYSFELHFQSLVNLIEKLELEDITLVVQDWGGLLGLSLLGEYPEKFKRVVIMNTFLPIGKPLSPFFKVWQLFARFHPSLPIGKIIQAGTYNRLDQEVLDAYRAPFPNRKHKDGAKAFPLLVPSSPQHDGVERMKKARNALSEWNKPALIIFSDKDKVMSGLENFFLRLLPSNDLLQKVTIKNAGHFLQEEKGEEIAEHIDAFIKESEQA